MGLSFSVDTEAQVLGPQRSLRKLSRKLRMGVEPSMADQDQLAAIAKEKGPQSAEVSNFLAEKAKEYTQSAEFNQKLRYHLQTLFRFTTFTTDAAGAPLVTEDVSGSEDPLLSVSKMSDALNASSYSVFSEVVEGNKSWDLLLTGKSYKINDSSLYFQDPKKTDYISEPSFFAKIKAESTIEGALSVFKPEDSRIAGILTSTQFRARYHAGPSNANRRLSQAVFRIFLCDNLQPAFIPVASEDEENLEILKGILDKLNVPGNTITEDQIKNMMSENEIKHGAEASCMSCHSKLDPFAQSFGVFGNKQLATTPAAGAIHFKRNVTDTVNIEGAGIGDLAKAITTLPEYLQCQTENFWKWFISEEVPLSDKRKMELSDFFSGKKLYGGQKIDKRAKEYVQMLVSQPEFRLDVGKLDPNSPEIMQSLLQSCNKCHAGNDIVTFGVRPFGGSKEEDARIISELKRRVIEVGPNHSDVMPPNLATWSENDLNKVKQWIQQLKPIEGINP